MDREGRVRIKEPTPFVTAAEVGLRSLRWLMGLQTAEAGHFRPIGSNGFFKQDGPRAQFDQQPVEAFTSVSACLEAWAATREEFWMNEARRSFEWFVGRNDLGQPLYDASTGGCFDALHMDRVNLNQGAESTLAFLLALQETRLAMIPLEAFDRPVEAAAEIGSVFCLPRRNFEPLNLEP